MTVQRRFGVVWLTVLGPILVIKYDRSDQGMSCVMRNLDNEHRGPQSPYMYISYILAIIQNVCRGANTLVHMTQIGRCLWSQWLHTRGTLILNRIINMKVQCVFLHLINTLRHPKQTTRNEDMHIRPKGGPRVVQVPCLIWVPRYSANVVTVQWLCIETWHASSWYMWPEDPCTNKNLSWPNNDGRSKGGVQIHPSGLFVLPLSEVVQLAVPRQERVTAKEVRTERALTGACWWHVQGWVWGPILFCLECPEFWVLVCAWNGCCMCASGLWGVIWACRVIWSTLFRS